MWGIWLSELCSDLPRQLSTSNRRHPVILDRYWHRGRQVNDDDAKVAWVTTPVVPVRCIKQACCKGFCSRLVCCSSPQSAPQQVLPFLTTWLANSVSQSHLAPYIFRVSLSNHRIVKVENDVGLWFHFSLPSTGLFHPADRNVPLVSPCLLGVQYPSGARFDSIRRGGRQA